ncbi:unnamed protein product, partial [Durusdinium trenchii]
MDGAKREQASRLERSLSGASRLERRHHWSGRRRKPPVPAGCSSAGRVVSERALTTGPELAAQCGSAAAAAAAEVAAGLGLPLPALQQRQGWAAAQAAGEVALEEALKKASDPAEAAQAAAQAAKAAALQHHLGQ